MIPNSNKEKMSGILSKKGASDYYSRLVHPICYMRAYNMTMQDIAHTLGVNLDTVSGILKTEYAQLKTQDIQKNLWGGDPAKRIQAIVNAAVDTALKIMLDVKNKPQVRLDAAKDFMDRGIGKATQPIEVGGSLVRLMIDKLDAIQNSGNQPAIHAESSNIEDASVVAEPSATATDTKDEVDEWMERNKKLLS